MNALLLNLVLAGIIEAPGAKSRALVGTPEAHCDQPFGRVRFVRGVCSADQRQIR